MLVCLSFCWGFPLVISCDRTIVDYQMSCVFLHFTCIMFACNFVVEFQYLLASAGFFWATWFSPKISGRFVYRNMRFNSLFARQPTVPRRHSLLPLWFPLCCKLCCKLLSCLCPCAGQCTNTGFVDFRVRVVLLVFTLSVLGECYQCSISRLRTCQFM